MKITVESNQYHLRADKLRGINIWNTNVFDKNDARSRSPGSYPIFQIPLDEFRDGDNYKSFEVVINDDFPSSVKNYLLIHPRIRIMYSRYSSSLF